MGKQLASSLIMRENTSRAVYNEVCHIDTTSNVNAALCTCYKLYMFIKPLRRYNDWISMENYSTNYSLNAHYTKIYIIENLTKRGVYSETQCFEMRHVLGSLGLELLKNMLCF
jgi:hypothetical protein